MPQMDDIQYWATQLKKTEEDIRPLVSKMHNQLTSLEIEELYALRESLTRYRSLISLLNDTLALPDPEPVPRWKKILFRR